MRKLLCAHRLQKIQLRCSRSPALRCAALLRPYLSWRARWSTWLRQRSRTRSPVSRCCTTTSVGDSLEGRNRNAAGSFGSGPSVHQSVVGLNDNMLCHRSVTDIRCRTSQPSMWKSKTAIAAPLRKAVLEDALHGRKVQAVHSHRAILAGHGNVCAVYIEHLLRTYEKLPQQTCYYVQTRQTLCVPNDTVPNQLSCDDG